MSNENTATSINVEELKNGIERAKQQFLERLFSEITLFSHRYGYDEDEIQEYKIWLEDAIFFHDYVNKRYYITEIEKDKFPF